MAKGRKSIVKEGKVGKVSNVKQYNCEGREGRKSVKCIVKEGNVVKVSNVKQYYCKGWKDKKGKLERFQMLYQIST